MPVEYTERSMLKYTQKVIDLFRNPKNMGEMEDPTVIAVEGDPQCGDMFKMFLKIENDKIMDAKFLSFGCLPPQEYISTYPGRWKQISKLKVGDAIIDSNGGKNFVVETYIRDYNGTLLRIVPLVSPFNSFLLTPEHPVLCVKREWLDSARKASRICSWLHVEKEELLSKKPKFIKARDIQVGDYLIFVPTGEIRDSKEYTANVMKLLGFYLSDGYTAANNHVLAFAFNKKETRNISEIKTLLRRVTNREPKYRARGNVTEVYICSKKWANFFISIAGKYATGKKLADEVLLLPFEQQWKMIKMYLKGNGNVHRRKKTHSWLYRIDTRSKDLAIQIQEILARGGILSYIKKSVRVASKINERKIRSNTNYTVSFQLKRKRKLVAPAKDYFLVPIKRIEKKNYSGKVYNFQVNHRPNSYLVRGFAVHNCAANIATGSMTTELVKGKTVDEASKLSIKEIARELELPAIKMHCAILAYKTLQKALREYKQIKEAQDTLTGS
ncbi:MAG TPA: hypothetical protein EYP46_03905 [Hadesarchaea archaeon]|nr:hypothetical protein [Hadesarchaea archaeon]